MRRSLPLPVRLLLLKAARPSVMLSAVERFVPGGSPAPAQPMQGAQTAPGVPGANPAPVQPAPGVTGAQPGGQQPQPQTAAPASPGVYYPKDVEGAAAAKKLGTENGEKLANLGKAKAALDSSVSTLTRLRDVATSIKNNPALTRITGLPGMLPNIPGGAAANLQAKLNTLKAQVGFGALQAMREASKTGGALGSVSDAEGIRLENSLTALDRAQDAPSFQQAMGDVIKYTNEAIGRMNAAYKQDYTNLRNGTQPQQPSRPQASAPIAVPPNAAAALRSDPGRRAEFDAKYGPGASAQILGQ